MAAEEGLSAGGRSTVSILKLGGALIGGTLALLGALGLLRLPGGGEARATQSTAIEGKLDLIDARLRRVERKVDVLADRDHRALPAATEEAQ